MLFRHLTNLFISFLSNWYLLLLIQSSHPFLLLCTLRGVALSSISSGPLYWMSPSTICCYCCYYLCCSLSLIIPLPPPSTSINCHAYISLSTAYACDDCQFPAIALYSRLSSLSMSPYYPASTVRTCHQMAWKLSSPHSINMSLSIYSTTSMAWTSATGWYIAWYHHAVLVNIFMCLNLFVVFHSISFSSLLTLSIGFRQCTLLCCLHMWLGRGICVLVTGIVGVCGRIASIWMSIALSISILCRCRHYCYCYWHSYLSLHLLTLWDHWMQSYQQSDWQ